MKQLIIKGKICDLPDDAEICPHCDGSGRAICFGLPAAWLGVCDYCDGRGYMLSANSSPEFGENQEQPNTSPETSKPNKNITAEPIQKIISLIRQAENWLMDILSR